MNNVAFQFYPDMHLFIDYYRHFTYVWYYSVIAKYTIQCTYVHLIILCHHYEFLQVETLYAVFVNSNLRVF